jgi:2-oxoglutarate dehydrogenase E2 component (dihydrolipoamide succinyltransferase)
MQICLSCDNRIIDSGMAVSFLVRVNQCIEDPSRMLLDAWAARRDRARTQEG